MFNILAGTASIQGKGVATVQAVQSYGMVKKGYAIVFLRLYFSKVFLKLYFVKVHYHHIIFIVFTQSQCYIAASQDGHNVPLPLRHPETPGDLKSVQETLERVFDAKMTSRWNIPQLWKFTSNSLVTCWAESLLLW